MLFKRSADDDERYKIKSSEVDWVKLQPFLLKRGYRLRPRYHPNWKPSWKRLWNFRHPSKCSDSLWIWRPMLLDAVRISDKQKVILKRVRAKQDVAVLQHLHSPSLEKDPRNNTVPILDVIHLPGTDDEAIIVMPVLYLFETPFVPFEHVSEIVEALDQYLKGLEFLHEQQIAHRDACYFNLMMDPTKVIPGGFHFAEYYLKPDGRRWITYRSRRSVGPVKYYFVDYETALYYPGNEHESYGTIGQDRTAPEFADDDALYDPFKLDVYQIGGVITELMERYKELHFLKPLEKRMKCQDPAQRLSAAQAYEEFCKITATLTEEEVSCKIKRIPVDLDLIGKPRPTVQKKSRAAVPHTVEPSAEPSKPLESLIAAGNANQASDPPQPNNILHTLLTSSPSISSPHPLETNHSTASEVAVNAGVSNEVEPSRVVLDDLVPNEDIPESLSKTSSPADTSTSQEAPHSISSSQSTGTLRSIDSLPTSVDMSERVQISQVVDPSQLNDTSKPGEPSQRDPTLNSSISPLPVPLSLSNVGVPLSEPEVALQSKQRRWNFFISRVPRSFRSHV